MAATALKREETKEFFDSPADLAAKLDTVSAEQGNVAELVACAALSPYLATGSHANLQQRWWEGGMATLGG